MFYRIIVMVVISSSLAFSSCGDNKKTIDEKTANVPTAQEQKNKQQDTNFVPVDEQPIPIKQVQPEYPEIARRAGVEGNVWLKVLIDVEGKVKDVQVMSLSSNLKNSGQPVGLQEAAIEAARKWTFKPAMKDNKPIETWVAIPFAFKLEKSEKKK